MFLLKDTTQRRRWGWNPRPFGPVESSNLPLSHCAPLSAIGVPHRIWVNVSLITGSKEQIIPLLAWFSKKNKMSFSPVPKPLEEHSVVFSFECLWAGRLLLDAKHSAAWSEFTTYLWVVALGPQSRLLLKSDVCFFKRHLKNIWMFCPLFWSKIVQIFE